VKTTTRVLDVSAFSKEMADAAGPPAPRASAAPRAGRAGRDANQRGGVDRRYLYNELVSTEGGMTALLLASRQGELESVKALLDSGADINQPGAGDYTTPLLIAAINGRFDLAQFLLAHGADPRLAAANGVTPLYAVINCQWAQKALYPQPRAFEQQATGYLDLMTALLDKGADPNVRVRKKVWYSGYNSDFSSIDEEGATVFWRAAYAADVEAMKLLVARGADPNIPTSRVPGRNRNGGGLSDEPVEEVSTKPPVPVGGPGMLPIHAASGPGYGEGFAGNAHRFTPGGLLAAVKYLVDDLHADVNVEDQDGNTPLHNAAARGDNEMIRYLVSKGADVKAVNRDGKTTVDMANGPVQRVQPFPETIALLEKLGAKNNHKCISC
jgi:ankyrin repeat protein